MSKCTFISRKIKPTLPFIIFLLPFHFDSLGEEIFKHRDENGRIIFSDKKKTDKDEVVNLKDTNILPREKKIKNRPKVESSHLVEKKSATFYFDGRVADVATQRIRVTLTSINDDKFGKAEIQFENEKEKIHVEGRYKEVDAGYEILKDDFSEPRNIGLSLSYSEVAGTLNGSLEYRLETSTTKILPVIGVISAKSFFSEKILFDVFGRRHHQGGVAFSATENPHNQIRNPKFNSGYDDWKIQGGLGWRFEEENENAQNGVLVFHSLSRSETLEAKKHTRASQCVPIEPNYYYKVAASFKSLEWPSEVLTNSLSVTWHATPDCSDIGSLAIVLNPEPMTGWQTLSENRLSPHDQVKAATVAINKAASNTKESSVYWDNIKFSVEAVEDVGS